MKPPSLSRRITILFITLFLISSCAPGAIPAQAFQAIPTDSVPKERFVTHFSDEYVAARAGKVIVEIPEVYELANIALAITPNGLKNPNWVLREGDYYQQVKEHFLPYRNHPLIKAISFGADQMDDYYGFRENSLAFEFDGDQIVDSGIYPTIWKPDHFSQDLALVEDFARVSGFRQFYADHQDYYQQEISTYQERVPVEDFWKWLEARFPIQHGSYKVVFSPLIFGSHSTSGFKSNGLSETVMFIAGPELYSEEKTEAVQSAFLARVVFTEIDHNYVNPITNLNTGKVNQAFEEMTFWADPKKAGYYANPASVFNEYMTWGVFLLYAQDTYPSKIYQTVSTRTIEQMEQQRGFVHFGAFLEELSRLYQGLKPGEQIQDLYPAILDWAEKQVQKP